MAAALPAVAWPTRTIYEAVRSGNLAYRPGSAMAERYTQYGAIIFIYPFVRHPCRHFTNNYYLLLSLINCSFI
jgi:hypothetical protein